MAQPHCGAGWFNTTLVIFACALTSGWSKSHSRRRIWDQGARARDFEIITPVMPIWTLAVFARNGRLIILSVRLSTYIIIIIFTPCSPGPCVQIYIDDGVFSDSVWDLSLMLRDTLPSVRLSSFTRQKFSVDRDEFSVDNDEFLSWCPILQLKEVSFFSRRKLFRFWSPIISFRFHCIYTFVLEKVSKSGRKLSIERLEEFDETSTFTKRKFLLLLRVFYLFQINPISIQPQWKSKIRAKNP